jgi:ribonuclease H2 subunit B
MSNIIIFIPNNEQKQECSNIELFKIIHPSSGLLSYFCIKNDELYELKQLSNENERSWFIENSVKEEGSLYCLSPFDPLFIFINIFEKMDDKKKKLYQPLDIILYNDEILGYSELNKIKNIEKRLKEICDINVLSIENNEVFYKFNEDKVLNWLTIKIEKLCTNFNKLKLCRNLLNKYEASPEDLEIKKKRISVILMSEYISLNLTLKLKDSLNIPEPTVNKVNYVYANDEDLIYNNNKRVSIDEVTGEMKKKKNTNSRSETFSKSKQIGNEKFRILL